MVCSVVGVHSRECRVPLEKGSSQCHLPFSLPVAGSPSTIPASYRLESTFGLERERETEREGGVRKREKREGGEQRWRCGLHSVCGLR